MWDVDFTGIGVEAVTMLAKTGLEVADEGKVAKVSAEKEAGLCVAEDVFYGVIAKYNEGGGVVALDRKGFKTVSYSGVIIPGHKELVADGAGGVKEPSPGVKAALITGVEGDNNAILFTAKKYGLYGHDIRIQLKDPAAASQALALDVVGQDIIISLATDATPVITSTAADIIAAISGSAAEAMITAENSGASTGAGVVAAVAVTALAGGVNPSVGKKHHVVSVDDTAMTLTLEL